MNFRFALPFLLLASPAYAVDFSQPILDEGKPLCMEETKGGECPPEKIATLGRVIRQALYASYPDEASLSGEDKYKRAEIAQAIAGAGDVKIKLEDRVLIKKLVGRFYNPMVVFHTWNMLEK